MKFSIPLIIIIIFIAVIIIFSVAKPKQKISLTEEEIADFTAQNSFDFINKNMVSGGPPKDGIPAIDNPKYVSAEEANLADSEIPQILSTAVSGPLKGESLEEIHIYVTTWKKWREKHPNTLVLSRDTGFDRNYDRNPYPGYDDILRVWFPVAAKSDRFHSKKIVVGIENNGEYLAVPKEEFKTVGKAEYNLGGDKVIIMYDDGLDFVKAYKEKVSEENRIKAFDLYWFAWYAYHPDTKVLE